MCEKMAVCERSVIHLTAHDRQCTADSTCMLGCGSANRVVHVVHIHGFVVAAAAVRESEWLEHILGEPGVRCLQRCDV